MFCTIIIFDNFSYVLLEAEKSSLLLKSLNFTGMPEKLNHAYWLVNSELFYRDTCNLEVLSAEDLDFVKTDAKDIALYPFHTYDNNIPQHLSNGEFEALKNVI